MCSSSNLTQSAISHLVQIRFSFTVCNFYLSVDSLQYLTSFSLIRFSFTVNNSNLTVDGLKYFTCFSLRFIPVSLSTFIVISTKLVLRLPLRMRLLIPSPSDVRDFPQSNAMQIDFSNTRVLHCNWVYGQYSSHVLPVHLFLLHCYR